LVAIALSYVGVFELFAAQGVVAAVVLGRSIENRDLDALFWYTVGCGAVLAALAAGSSPWMAGFFGIDRLEPMVQVMALGILIRAMTVVHEAKLIRDMNFKSLAMRLNAATLVSAVAGISIALAGGGAWALVIQWLVKVFGIMVILWGASSWRPRFHLRSANSPALISLSWKSFPATLFDYATSHTEPIVMGRLFGEVAVGIYRLASRLLDLVISIVTRALWHVSFPYLAEVKGDPALLRERISTCMRYSLLCSVPVVWLLVLESPALIDLFGEKWAPAIPVVRILCVYAMIRSVILFNGPLLLAWGRPRTFSAVVGVQSAVAITSMVGAAYLLGGAAIEQQLSGIAWARVAAYASVSLPVLAFILIRWIKLPGSDFASVAMPAAIVTAVAVLFDAFLISSESALGLSGTTAFFSRVLLTGTATLLLVAAVDRQIREAIVARFRPMAQAQSGAGED
jgi:PST family polysaccharide transporter